MCLQSLLYGGDDLTSGFINISYNLIPVYPPVSYDMCTQPAYLWSSIEKPCTACTNAGSWPPHIPNMWEDPVRDQDDQERCSSSKIHGMPTTHSPGPGFCCVFENRPPLPTPTPGSSAIQPQHMPVFDLSRIRSPQPAEQQEQCVQQCAGSYGLGRRWLRLQQGAVSVEQ